MSPEPPSGTLPPSSGTLPPPSASLLARVDAMRPVRTRRPRLEAAVVALASLAALAALLTVFRPRSDLSSLIVDGVAAVCALVFGAELWWALVPPRGQVLPLRRGAGARVLGAWLVVVAALVITGHDLAPDPRFMASARACLLVGTMTALIPAFLCLVLLRRAVDLGGWRIGAVVGGAAGALGALCLQLHCANTHLWHVVVAHGGAALLPIAIFAFVTRK
ncbi:MAG TPA: NrsF family protein [Polyangia bacterium]|nr:NrsF family protein [Polyangia bacterium]